MNKTQFVKTVFCTAAMLCSSALFAKAPQWTKNPTKDYPAAKYFTGVGSGKNQKQAELDAVEKLAAIFGRDVTSVAKSSQRMIEAQKDGSVQTGSISNFGQNVTQKVAVEDLIGIELKETAEDAGVFYALAVLDKKATETILVSSISANNAKAKKLISGNAQDVYSFENYARHDYAREIAILDEKMMKKLDVIAPAKAASMKDDLVSSAMVQTKIIELAKMIPIYVEITGDDNNTIKQEVCQLFEKHGFRTSNIKGERYRFLATLNFDRRDPKDGKTIQAYYSFDGKLMDSNMAETMWSASFNGRESATDIPSLASRTYRTMASKVKSSLDPSFNKFLAGIRTE